METWTTWIIRISLVAAILILFASVGDASVTWRRVTKPSLKPQTSVVESTTSAKSTTKSPITWKRSTIVRRSTDASEDNEDEGEFDDLTEASSEKEEDLKELENDSEVKPLVPGSRPGFWFDSSRKKKPSSLLRPAERKNSLFPSRSTTSTSATPISSSVTPSYVIPRTPPLMPNSNSRNTSTKFFGRTRSTSTPFAFKRRLKTTKTPKISSTIESPDFEKDKETNFEETNTEIEKDSEALPEELKSNDSENERPLPIRPKFNSRRRPYNGTRLSWMKQNKSRHSKTTITPQQLTTTNHTPSVARDYERLLRKTTKFPRTRSKTKTTPSQDTTPQRVQQTTVTPITTSTISNKFSENVTESKSDTRTKNIVSSNKKNNFSELQSEEQTDDFVQETTLTPENYDVLRQNASEEPIPKQRTTVEPFYITKDYGRIATAIPEFTKSKDETEIKPSEEDSVPAFPRVKERITSPLPEKRTDIKRIRKKTTKVPEVTSTVSTKFENIEKEFDYDNEDIDASVEFADDFKWKQATTERPRSSTIIEELIPEKISGTKSTTVRPVTFPSLPPIDPNSNAYVVWSVGHGGSGWSYQKQGPNVKWSAQNSEADGDSWSVVGKDNSEEKTNYSNQWVPTRQAVPDYQTSERNKNKMNSKKKMSDAYEIASPVTYIPNLPFKNETILNFKNSDNLSLRNTSFPQLSVPVLHQTAPPTFPTEEDQFNVEVENIANQYPFLPEYPYVSGNREKYNIPFIPTNASTVNLVEDQEYPSKLTGDSRDYDFATPSSIYPEPQTNPYPTISPQYETLPPYATHPVDSDIGVSSVKQTPTLKTAPQSYLSRIPPELAKAVVRAKKWKVVGSGGDEGWSLLNEDGMLEWKIHNVDGHWRVSSADQLQDSQAPTQENTGPEKDQESRTEDSGSNYPLVRNPTKIWTLEDDYEKWKAVSTERGIPVDESLQETSSQEYDYNSSEYNDDYYTGENYYYTSSPMNTNTEPYSTDEDYGSRPLWGSGENEMIDSYSKDYSPFSGNIEMANSRDDAVDAWKSLIAQQGYWKFADNSNEKVRAQAPEPQKYVQGRTETSRRKDSRFSNRQDSERTNQNNYHEATEGKYERPAAVTLGSHRISGNSHQREEHLSPIKRGNERRHEKTAQEIKEEKNIHVQRRPSNSYDKLKEVDLPTLNVKLYESNYESIPESSEKHHGKIQPGNEYLKNIRYESKIPERNQKMTERPNENRGQKYKYDTRNEPEEKIAGRYENEPKEKNSNGREREPELQLRNYNPHPIAQGQKLNAKISDKNNEELIEENRHVKSRDHSKLDSLISKLETIQKEAKGRAVIDLTVLLNQMKERRNMTSHMHRKSNTRHQNTRTTTFDGKTAIENEKHANNNAPLVRTEIQQMRKNSDMRKYIHHDSKINRLDGAYHNMDPQNRIVQNMEQRKINSQNHRVRNLNQSNRKRNSVTSLSQPESLPRNQTHPKRQEKTYPPARPTAQFNQRNPSPAENHPKNPQEIQRYSEIERKHRTSTEPNMKVRRTDSSSSEEIKVNLRDDDIKNKSPVSSRRHRRPNRKRSRRPHHPKPIVMKGETEIEDEESGSLKSRKIIVIDYAGGGVQKNKSPVDKKDLELIIKNVKHRRSEMNEDNEDSGS